MKLPPEARGALAARLIDSLDDGIDPAAEDAWDQEIQRRITELDEGRVTTVPWSEVRRRLMAQ